MLIVVYDRDIWLSLATELVLVWFIFFGRADVMVRHIYCLGSIDIYIRGIIDAASSCDSGRGCMVAGGLMMECDLE